MCDGRRSGRRGFFCGQEGAGFAVAAGLGGVRLSVRGFSRNMFRYLVVRAGGRCNDAGFSKARGPCLWRRGSARCPVLLQ